MPGGKDVSSGQTLKLERSRVKEVTAWYESGKRNKGARRKLFHMVKAKTVGYVHLRNAVS